METIDKIKLISKILDNKKAEDIEIISIKDLSIISDYFVIASATNVTQAKALADEVEFKLKQKDIIPVRIEGYASANWIILDYSDIVVHIFHKEAREYYSLDKLWSNGEKIDYKKYLD